MKTAAGKLLAALLAASIFLCLFKGDILKAEEANELYVFAAASLTESLEQIADLYKSSHEGTDIIFNFDSSGILKSQIEEGAYCDIFISASTNHMDELENDGYILEESKVDLLGNKIVLAMPSGKEAFVRSFDELAELLKDGKEEKGFLLAIGSSDMPAGQYARKLFEYYGIDEKELNERGILTYAGNVKEIITQLSEATVDMGIVYATDVFTEDIQIIDAADEESTGPIIYPAAVIRESENKETAMEFAAFLQGDEAVKIFESMGFDVYQIEEKQ